jgi:hypothetical protein
MENIEINFYFPYVKNLTKDELINHILKNIKNNKFVGYAGFLKKKDLKLDLYNK